MSPRPLRGCLAHSLGQRPFQPDERESDGISGRHFDVVFSSMFLHELPLKDIRAYLAEAHRVLKPGGILLTMELPPNNRMEPYDRFYLDWDYYNKGLVQAVPRPGLHCAVP